MTILSADSGIVEVLRPALQGAGFEVVAVNPGRETEPDPAAAPDVVAVDFRDQSAPARSPYLEAWSRSLALALVHPAQVSLLDPALAVEDFIVTPVTTAEFLARVKQALWRHGRASSGNTLSAGDLVIDLGNYKVYDAGRPLTFTYKEYDLLRFLMTHAGTVLSRETLLNRVWGYDYYGGSRTVDVHIRRVRAKLEPSRYDYIETIRNVGYRFTQPLK